MRWASRSRAALDVVDASPGGGLPTVVVRDGDEDCWYLVYYYLDRGLYGILDTRL